MTTLERAIALAAEAHAGAVDKAGHPYILHPLRVMLAQRDPIARIAAVLHDVVEDTATTFDTLREEGFSEEVLSAVESVTKRPEDKGKDAYFAFVERAARHPIGRAVKAADIEDNLDPTRIANPSENDLLRMARYHSARALIDVIALEEGDSASVAPMILPLRGTTTIAEVEAACPGSREIVACDFYMEGAEDWEPVPGGLRSGRVTNVDHHASLAEMRRDVTSTVLACQYARERSAAAPRPWVVINHTDCDSMLSSAIVMGLLPAEKIFEDASIAADHHGAQNDIADLLQSLDQGRKTKRTRAQYLESIEQLRLLLAGERLSDSAQRSLDSHRARRVAAERVIREGRVEMEAGVALVLPDEELDGAFFPALVPDAEVILLATPIKGSDRWLIKVRRGLAAPAGFTLEAKVIREWDPNYGGRWNAGSNSRSSLGGGSGSTLAPAAWAARMRAMVAKRQTAQNRATFQRGGITDGR